MAKKKVTEKDMYPYTYSSLRSRYPASEGWVIYPQDTRGKNTYIPDFTVEKVARKYIYRIPVEVKKECKATQAHINQLNRYAKSHAGSNVKIENKILVFPSEADTSLVPADIEVIYLRKFTCS